MPPTQAPNSALFVINGGAGQLHLVRFPPPAGVSFRKSRR